MDYTFNTKTVINEDFILKKDDTLTVMGESELIIGETVRVTFNANGTIIILGKLVLLNCDFNNECASFQNFGVLSIEKTSRFFNGEESKIMIDNKGVISVQDVALLDCSFGKIQNDGVFSLINRDNYCGLYPSGNGIINVLKG